MLYFIRTGAIYMVAVFLAGPLMTSGIIPVPLKTELLEGFYELPSVLVKTWEANGINSMKINL